MSALARYFMHEGKLVAGYDRTATPLTHALEKEGAVITYEDKESTIPDIFKDVATTLVVYTPAIPTDSVQMSFFRNGGFEMLKRSRMLGVVSEGKYVMAVAGTHGKTTTTTMTAWFNHIAGGGGSAFLGGISKNFNSNLVLGQGNRLAVEADEFDRSFLQLHPDVAVITAADADHLDIYGTHDAVKEAFSAFISQIKPGGTLILKHGVDLVVKNENIKVYRYAYDTPSDFYAKNIRPLEGGHYMFDIVCPDREIKNCTLGIPGWVNIENCIAAVSLLCVAGFDEGLLKTAMASFTGVKRRFDFYINNDRRVYVDDYAHHPEELRAAIKSLKAMFPKRKLTVVFQPHLYTRTRDFYKDFAEVLSMADEVLLMPIYPAREEPIPGINSELIAGLVTVPVRIVQKNELIDVIKAKNPEFLVTFGAGDIDNFCTPIAETLKLLD